MKTDSLKTFCEALKHQNDFFMASNVNPEGDAIGSLIAIDSLLRRLGKRPPSFVKMLFRNVSLAFRTRTGGMFLTRWTEEI